MIAGSFGKSFFQILRQSPDDIDTRGHAYLDKLLDTGSIPDYGNALNGLQLENDGAITKAAASVDFSSRVVNLAIEQKRGLPDPSPWNVLERAQAYNRQCIRENARTDREQHCRLLVASAARPASAFGNNVLLSKELGLEASGEFARYKGIAIGLKGESDIATSVLLERSKAFAQKHGGDAVASAFSEKRVTHRWAMCTGAGASSETLEEAQSLGVDTLIVGEGPHHTAVQADELGIVVIYAGHYATETLGVTALAQHVAEKFGIDWTMISAPTGL